MWETKELEPEADTEAAVVQSSHFNANRMQREAYRRFRRAKAKPAAREQGNVQEGTRSGTPNRYPETARGSNAEEEAGSGRLNLQQANQGRVKPIKTTTAAGRKQEVQQQNGDT